MTPITRITPGGGLPSRFSQSATGGNIDGDFAERGFRAFIKVHCYIPSEGALNCVRLAWHRATHPWTGWIEQEHIEAGSGVGKRFGECAKRQNF